MPDPLYPKLRERAREMRKAPTEAERRLWARLRGHRFEGLKFHRQYPLEPYILDFYCPEKKLCVELDGGQHAEPEHAGYDADRTKAISGAGIRIIRFWNGDVMKDLDTVLETIGKAAGIF